jgi:hypothetical protein
MRGFEQALKHPVSAQRRVRNRLVRLARHSAYGKFYGVTSSADFRHRLPLVDYDTLSTWLDRVAAGERGVLSPERVSLLEATSGSSGAKKLIPYPPALRKVFTRMALLWLHDLLRTFPQLGRGRFYFSVSPQWGERAQAVKGLRVGLDSDADYLGPWLKPLLAPFVVSLEKMDALTDAEAFQTALCHALLSAQDLEAISVWNPTFFTVLLDRIETQRELLAEDLTLPENVRAALNQSPIEWHRIWPALQLVSCWADAQAAFRAAELHRRLPGVRIQPKGLLATEAPVTVPLEGVTGGVPLVADIYFEFENETGDVLELHEIELGATYALIVSQPGGLYRYRLGDQVRVAGRYHATPTLQLEGRGALVSDLVGEKLSEGFLRRHVLPLLPPVARVSTFVPLRNPADAYVLLLDACPAPLPAWEDRIEQELQRGHHYALARELGQLGPLRIVVHPEAERLMLEFQVRHGLRLGDIKPSLLLIRPADEMLLAALCISA